MSNSLASYFFTACVAVAGGIAIGHVAEKQNHDKFGKDVFKTGKATEILVTDWDGTQRVDTIITLPLNASKDFKDAASPLIKDGTIKIKKFVPESK